MKNGLNNETESKSIWPEILRASRHPLSLVALLLLVIFSSAFPKIAELTGGSPIILSIISLACIFLVLLVVIYQIAKTSSSRYDERIRDNKALAESLGQCIANAVHAHISNLQLPEERSLAYARIVRFVRGSETANDPEFRGIVSDQIYLYATTLGGCSKSEIDRTLDE